MSERAEDFLDIPEPIRIPEANEPDDAVAFLDAPDAAGFLDGEPAEDTTLRNLGAAVLKGLLRMVTPFEGPRKALGKAAGMVEETEALEPRVPDAAKGAPAAAVEAVRSTLTAPLVPILPLARKGGPLSPEVAAETMALTPLDVATLGLAAASKVAGLAGKAAMAGKAAEAVRTAVPASEAAASVVEGAVKPAASIAEATSRLEKAAATAPKASGLVLQGGPKPAGELVPGLGRVDTSSQARKLIEDVAASNKVQIDEARRGVITLEETKRLADDLGMTPEDLLKRHKGEAFNAETALAARQVLVTSAEKTWEAAKGMATGKTSLSDFAESLARHVDIQAEVSGVAAEAGRALGSFRIPAGATKEKILEIVNKSLGGEEIAKDVAERLAKLDPTDIRSVNIFLRDISKAGTRDKVFEAWMNGLLSGPQTHVVNALSNTLTLMSRPVVERPAAAGIDFLRSLATGSERERFFGEAMSDLVGIARGIPEGVTRALQAFRDEIPTFGASKIEVSPGARQAIKGTAGRIIRIPVRALSAADDFFKVVARSGELYARAYRDAVRSGLKGRELIEHMAQVISEPGRALEASIRQEAIYRTFQAEPGEAGKALESLRNRTPGLRYVLPFLRTPTNVAKFGLERTPLNFLRIAKQSAGKKLVGGELSEELAKPVMGSLIGATVAYYASEGKITGGGPRNPIKRRALQAAGWQPYSVKIGDRYYSYGRLEPLSIIVGMTADFTELFDLTDREEAVGKIGLAIAQNLSNKTFLRGVSELLNAISDPERYGDHWIQNVASSMVPNVASALARANDPYVRHAQTVGQAFKKKLPGLSSDVPIMRDIWGEPIAIPGSPVERLLSPVYRSNVVSNDRAINEIVRLQASVGTPRRELGEIELTEDEYGQYARDAGSLAKQIVGKLIASPGYSRIPDEVKREEIERIFVQTRRAARGKLLQRNPRLRPKAP